MRNTGFTVAWTSEDRQRELDGGNFSTKQEAVNSLQSFASELISMTSDDDQKDDIYHGVFVIFSGEEKAVLPVSDFYKIAA